MSHELAQKIFSEIFDDEMLEEMESKGVITQKLGFECTVVAVISIELESYMQQGLTVSEYLKLARDNVSGKPVTFNLKRYIAGDVNKNGMVDLYLKPSDKSPFRIEHSDLIEFTGE